MTVPGGARRSRGIPETQPIARIIGFRSLAAPGSSLSPARPSLRVPYRRRGWALYERMGRLARRLLPSVLKWTGMALVLVSCTLLVYLGAVMAARLMAGGFFP